MGILNFFKVKSPKLDLPPEFQKDIAQMISMCFPQGNEQMDKEASQLHALLSGRLNKYESLRILIKTKSLLFIAKDKSQERVVESIIGATRGKLTKTEAKLVFQFITGISSDMYSGGDGSSVEEAVVINATSSLVGVPAEYEWISGHFGKEGVDWEGGGRRHGQTSDGKYIEIFTLNLPDGSEALAVFDITAFFGRA